MDTKFHLQLTRHVCIMYAGKTLFSVAELHYASVGCLQGKQSLYFTEVTLVWISCRCLLTSLRLF